MSNVNKHIAETGLVSFGQFLDSFTGTGTHILDLYFGPDLISRAPLIMKKIVLYSNCNVSKDSIWDMGVNMRVGNGAMTYVALFV